MTTPTAGGICFAYGSPPTRHWHMKSSERESPSKRHASLHRHTFEITRIAGTPTAGVHKDVAEVGGYQSLEIDFVADQPGLSLLHCHRQIHMDYGFMLLLNGI
jgi:Multicopper oxidase